MKITDLHIEDPRQRAILRDPWVELRVDEPVNEVGTKIYSDLSQVRHGIIQYAVIPCGPFFAVEVCLNPSGSWVDLDEEPRASYGEFNLLNLLGGKQLIPVEVFTPDGEDLPLAMEVTRLRRLIRKFRYPYVVLVDEQSAIQGQLKWRLEFDSPMCYGGALGGSELPCLREPKTTVLWKDTHLSLCDVHLDTYQALRRELRVAH